MPPIPEDSISEAEHFAGLAERRAARERKRTAFLDKVNRTSRSHRRWFRIRDIEPDESARAELIQLWRQSIHSGDLNFKGKLQILCLTVSPLFEGYRFDRELARGELFNHIIDDLWMSAPRWREWFRQIGRPTPGWLAQVGRKTWRPKLDQMLTVSEADVMTALNELWPDGPAALSEVKPNARNRRINEWRSGKEPRASALDERTIQRACKKIRYA